MEVEVPAERNQGWVPYTTCHRLREEEVLQNEIEGQKQGVKQRRSQEVHRLS